MKVVFPFFIINLWCYVCRYTSARKLLKLESIQFILENHTVCCCLIESKLTTIIVHISIVDTAENLHDYLRYYLPRILVVLMKLQHHKKCISFYDWQPYF